MDFHPTIIQNLTSGRPGLRVPKIKGAPVTHPSAPTHDRNGGSEEGGSVWIEDDDLFAHTPARSTPMTHIALDLSESEAPYTQSRAEAIVELIVKSDRVFLDGACWRCTERLPLPGSDLGLCELCLEELKG
jgi:hypothetical protein